MKIVQVTPRLDIDVSLKKQLKAKERELRGPSTWIRKREGRWAHKRYKGWIKWDEAGGGIVIAEIHTRDTESEWQLVSSFVGYLERHLSESIDSITIIYR